MTGRLILLHGPSSAGKSTLALAIQARAEIPLVRLSLDLFLFGPGVLPARRDGAFAWAALRPRLFEGYRASLAAMLAVGVDLVVDHVIETAEEADELATILAPYDSFLVGLRCPLDELERRERTRGDRRPGDARRDAATVHTLISYDLEVDSTDHPEANAERVLAAWAARRGPGVLARRALEVAA